MLPRVRVAVLVPLALSFACRAEYVVQRAERVDVFQQTRQVAVDLLLVIDNSCSMLDEQDHLADSFDALIAALEAGDTDWRVATTTSEPALPQYRGRLSGGTDEIVLWDPDGAELDRVVYDDLTWPILPGTTLVRCDPTAAPDDSAAWQAVPGGAPRSDTCAGPPVAGTDRGPRPPEAGDVRVAAFEPWPEGDPRCAWVELHNPTPDTLALGGVAVGDDGRNRAVLPEGLALGPGESVVVGRAGAAGCDPAPEIAVDGLTFARGARWIDAETEDAAAVFSELVAVGTGAFGLEMGMENAKVTLTAPPVERDAAFLRADADLALLFFSDEDDVSPAPVHAYVDAFRSLKGDAGYRDPERVRVGAAVGTSVPGAPGDPCAGGADLAERYLALVDATAGTSWSICGDLSQVADQAGVTFSEQLVEFQLSAFPALETLLVQQYETEDEESLVGALAMGVDFGLEVREQPDGALGVWMTFPEDRVPPGHYVVVEYEVLPNTVGLEVGPMTPTTGAP